MEVKGASRICGDTVMKILGLDSSGMVASVAIVEDGVLLAEYTVNYKKTHSQTLLPMLEELRRMVELDLDTVDAIAVASGPGSFTGLRIGTATAKGLGFALEKPLVEVPTLQGLAYNLCGTEKLVCPLMDARRNQVYTGIYGFMSEAQIMQQEGERSCHVPELLVLEPQCAVDIMEIIEKVNALGRAVIFLGDGVEVHRRVLEEQVLVPYTYAPASNNRQRAASVAALGAVYFAKGRTVTAAEHSPNYLRKSQAERVAGGDGA